METGAPTIDAELVGRLVRAQFPKWADLPVQPVKNGGWDNRTFHLGPSLLARLPSAERYAAQVEKEQTWLPRLAPLLPVAIPEPVAMGRPAEGYPWRWSIYRWIDGDAAEVSLLRADRSFARALAAFLAALHAADAGGGPAPGPHSFFRGGPLSVYDAETREAISRLEDRNVAARATRLWDHAVSTRWRERAVWVHGDFAAGNLLVRDGRLAAVIDFGCLSVGDPACDLGIAWTFLDPAARTAFRAALDLDEATWSRAKGWVLWKALILVTGLADVPAGDLTRAKRILNEVLSE
jgi:aminoglycoside phosphotransferase (APT) family kinase protein